MKFPRDPFGGEVPAALSGRDLPLTVAQLVQGLGLPAAQLRILGLGAIDIGLTLLALGVEHVGADPGNAAPLVVAEALAEDHSDDVRGPFPDQAMRERAGHAH